MTPTSSYDGWEIWWSYNRDRFLDLRARMDDPGTRSGASRLTGRGRRFAAGDHRPSSHRILSDVVPGLLEVLERSDDRDLLDSALLGVARTCGGGRCASTVFDAALPLLQHPESSVRTAAILALGVLGEQDAAPLLREIMADTSAGRRATGGGQVDWLTRSFAAVSLGLIGDPVTVDALMDVVDRLPDSERDVKVCAIVALGLLGPEHPRTPDVSAFLLEKLVDRRLDPVIKSYVPTSLGKLGDRGAVVPLLGVLGDRDTDWLVKQSCVIGLGRLATMEDDDVLRDLIKLIEHDKNGQSRHFGLIALGSIGARDAEPADHAAAHDDVRRLLAGEITKPRKSRAHRSWAALGGALYARSQDDARALVLDRLMEAYDEESDPGFRGAFALSLGLLDDQSSAERLYDDFRSARQADFRGTSALALGFLGHRDAIDPLRQLCIGKGVDPALRQQAATALALMADRSSVPVLVQALIGSSALEERAALSKGLGIVGDQNAIPPLVAVAFDPEVVEQTRAFACVALGLICEKTQLPWHAPIREDTNYSAMVPSLAELLDIL